MLGGHPPPRWVSHLRVPGCAEFVVALMATNLSWAFVRRAGGKASAPDGLVEMVHGVRCWRCRCSPCAVAGRLARKMNDDAVLVMVVDRRRLRRVLLARELCAEARAGAHKLVEPAITEPRRRAHQMTGRCFAAYSLLGIVGPVKSDVCGIFLLC